MKNLEKKRRKKSLQNGGYTCSSESDHKFGLNSVTNLHGGGERRGERGEGVEEVCDGKKRLGINAYHKKVLRNLVFFLLYFYLSSPSFPPPFPCIQILLLPLLFF